ncbi:MAG: FAD-dependent oxidoreductase, partial [Trueperaceae bacterium]
MITWIAIALGVAGAQAPADGARPVACDRFDVIVLGSEPEAVAAAIAAAETGARTLLATPDQRLGGLFTLGAMNVLDVRTSPVNFQEGLFRRWWRRVGGANAFDPDRAERTFAQMLHEAGVEVRTGVHDLRIEVADGGVRGAVWSTGHARADQVVDGDQDLRFAVEAGASADVGFERYGAALRMADTLMFRIDGLDWSALQAAARERGRAWATVDDAVAWGHFGGVPASYASQQNGIRLRGLNLGRDDAGGVWVNALLIHGVDWTNEQNRADARARAEVEAHDMVAWLRTRLPGFAGARVGAVAERLYVRETRHLHAVCVLDADHLLDNRTGPLDVAVGGYPLDLQALTPHDAGYVFGTPDVYGVPLCATVPADGP